MKNWSLIAVCLAFVLSSCGAVQSFDDSKILESINDLQRRVVALEELCGKMNTNIASMQTVVTALEGNDYVVNVSPVMMDGLEVGYNITFAKSGTVTIYHGKNGAGNSVPVIGVAKDADGFYYWTLDGEWLLDSDGNKVRANGKDGADGSDGETPQLKIEDGYWYVSYDKGSSWIRAGQATGEDGADGGTGVQVTQDEDNVYFTLADGTVIAVTKNASDDDSAGIPQVTTECGPWVTNVTENEMTVVWISSDRAMGWVEVAPDDGTSFYAEERPRHYEDYLGRHLITKVHHVTITGLEPGTSYRYRIFQQAVDDSGHDPIAGPITASSVYGSQYCIRTLDKSSDECRFIMLNDIHSRDDILHSHGSKVRDFNPDFVVFNGDMSNMMGTIPELEEGYLNRSVKDFATDFPLFFVRGNHEGRGPGANEFMNLFPTSTGLPYYMFRQGVAAFVVLDCGEDKPDSDIEYGGTAAFDKYRAEQAEWLRNTVQSEEFLSAPVKVALLHVPPEKGSGWYGSNELKRLMIPILDEAGTAIMFSGHTHKYSFRQAGECDTTFPVMVNSNDDRLEVVMTAESVVIDVIDPSGNRIHQHIVPVK